MKVISFSTFDKYSRFYLDIEKQLKANRPSETVNFKMYSIYFSGFLYALLRLKHSNWIPVTSWFNALKNRQKYLNLLSSTETYKGLRFKDFCKFHVALNKSTSQQDLQLQALAYIDLIDRIFNTEQPDYLICLGDSRMSIEIAIALAQLKQIKVYYIEQGPFNTTFFDHKGVNANISFREQALNLENIKTPKNTEAQQASKKYRRSPIYRALDMALMYSLQKTKIYPPDVKYTDLNSYRAKRKNPDTTLHTEKPMVLLILQVPLDVNMIYHSPHFKSHTEIVSSVYAALPKNTDLVIREHPLFVGKYEASLYQLVKDHHIRIDNLSPLKSSIESSKFVVVNNSTVGLEAIFYGQTVVVLGNAFYDNSEVCLKLKEKTALVELLEKAMNHKPDPLKIDTFKTALYNSVLLQGGITDQHLKSTKTIAQHLLNDK